MNQRSNTYDLEERTALFTESIIDLVKTIKITSMNKSIIEQLIRSAGSVGANYCEATEAESRKDFVHKIGIVKKETKESRYWLRMLAKANPEIKECIVVNWKEAQELLFIWSKTIQTAKLKK